VLDMQLSGIDTNLVIALRALLEHRNVTLAGREIGLSQSSMSHALARLRTHFNDSLLVPVGHEMVLTGRAKTLLAPVTEAIACLERVFDPVEHFDPETSRRVFRIAASDNLELYLLPRLAGVLSSTAPGIELRVCPQSDGWMHALQRGDLDLELGCGPNLPSGLESQDLGDEPFACVVRHGHAAPAKPSLQAYAALDHMVVAPTGSASAEPCAEMNRALAKYGLRRRVKMTIPHFMVAPFVVASSELALEAPARLLDPFIKTLRLRRLELPAPLASNKLWQAWVARVHDDPAHRWLRANIARLFAEREATVAPSAAASISVSIDGPSASAPSSG
jgi:DNA-binding transcriptional LysR family regulator